MKLTLKYFSSLRSLTSLRKRASFSLHSKAYWHLIHSTFFSDMSFEDFASTCMRTFSQTPIRLMRISSPLIAYADSLDHPYSHLVLLCQPHFTSKTISIAFYLNGTAYFEYLTEDKIRQRLQVLNPRRKTSIHREDVQSVIRRLKELVLNDADNTQKCELNAKLLSTTLLSIEISQDDFKFKFRCDERAQLYEQHYVRQLLIQVKELSDRQAYLCELLEHKDQLPQFDAKLFLSTPMTLDDDQEGNRREKNQSKVMRQRVFCLDDEEENEETSSSKGGSLWKSVFSRRDGRQFLDICLLKKAYMKALEEMSDDDEQEEEEDDEEAVSSVINTLVNQIDDQQEDDDEVGLAQRIKKRSLTTSTMNLENETHPMKRLRGNAFV